MKDQYRTFRTHYKEISLNNQTLYNIAGIERWSVGKEGRNEALREITLQLDNASDFNLDFYALVELKRVLPKEEHLFVWVKYVTHTQNALHIFVEHFDIQ